jgi:hypothetical protein
LQSPDVANTARKYPIIKEIEVSYDFIRDHRSETVPQGFHLRLVFGDSRSDDQRGKRLYFTAASELDALQDQQGNPVAPTFEPKDILGELQSRGSNEWK